MNKFSAVFCCFLLITVLLASTSVEIVESKVSSCYLATSTGGCPNKQACIETCVPCYRGVGSIVASCEAPLFGLPMQCVCYFKDGAPCPPTGPPRCPAPPALNFTYFYSNNGNV